MPLQVDKVTQGSENNATRFQVINLGLKPYGEVRDIMKTAHEKIAQNESERELIFLVQHLPVVTVGNRNLVNDVLQKKEELQSLGVEYFELERGGSATVHEPGQLVMYPLLRCSPGGLSVKKLVWSLEEAMIRVCAHYGVVAARDAINPGIWVGQNKVGAIGLRIKNRVSFHGCALNVSNSLATFAHIIPCGLLGRGVTSIQREAGVSENVLKIKEVETLLAKSFLEYL
jgi:lipoyl(octanoyl) transferase